MCSPCLKLSTTTVKPRSFITSWNDSIFTGINCNNDKVLPVVYKTKHCLQTQVLLESLVLILCSGSEYILNALIRGKREEKTMKTFQYEIREENPRDFFQGKAHVVKTWELKISIHKITALLKGTRCLGSVELVFGKRL